MPTSQFEYRGITQSMNDESVLENRESLAPSQKDRKKNSPILEALSRHVSQWPDTLRGKTKEVQLRKEDN